MGRLIHVHTLARKSEILFHMKCEVKVKVKSIRCFHVKSRTLRRLKMAIYRLAVAGGTLRRRAPDTDWV